MNLVPHGFFEVMEFKVVTCEVLMNLVPHAFFEVMKYKMLRARFS